MAELNGINTENMSAAIRAKIYSGILRTQLEPELTAMNFRLWSVLLARFTKADIGEILALSRSASMLPI